MTKYYIRRFATVFLGLIIFAQAYAQHTVNFTFTQTAPDNVLKRMAANTNAVFEEINRAYRSSNEKSKQRLTLSTTNATEKAIGNIQSLWATGRFQCLEPSIILRVTKMADSPFYQVRNIPIFINADNNANYKEEDQNQDVIMEFDPNGKISDMYISINQHRYIKFANEINPVTDLRYKQSVTEFVEQMCVAYNRKDLQFIEKIYSEDALIITATREIVPQKRGDAAMTATDRAKYKYTQQTKQQYIAKLRDLFRNKDYIKISFEDIVVRQHGVNDKIYGVTLKQHWNHGNYKGGGGYDDKGWLFLVIDYTDDKNPQIWVRTWQPLEDENKIPLDPKDIYTLDDFNLQ